ncbi:MAG TPA: neocarzinostatin apoprotein domain-containing protein, partial [Acidimicrobiales bacterium]|nr:neocarzinostatin apoprotein domain-containing protein [Acidimicrobiales bacterium]
MAEYEPFPTGSGPVEHDRDLTKKVLGCFGLGSLGVIGAVVAVMVLLGALASFASGCDFEVGDPGDGKDSQRLTVGVAPKTGLSDATAVRVTSTAFQPDTIVGVAVCLRAADTERKGVEACDENQGSRFATTAEGELDATYAVPRVITVGGTAYDCAAEAGACLVVAADASDYDQSGGQPVTFRSGLPAADLTPVTVRPVSDHLPIGAQPPVGSTPVAAGTGLKVLASGFQPGEPLLIAHCTSKVEEDGIVGTCE